MLKRLLSYNDSSMKNFILGLLDFIYKKKCYFCGSSRESVSMCSKCFNELEFNNILVDREILGVKVFISGCYEKYSQKLIRGIKYHVQKDLAYYQARFMYEYFSDVIDKFHLSKDFCIIPVPLHKNREKKRGYNHMELVAKEFSQMSGFEYCSNFIKRVKATKPQYKLSRVERINNLSGAFSVDILKKPNKTILLIDDICTSGTTFEVIIEELHKNGIKDIICFATTSPNS